MIAVIGAGVAGLAAARVLHAAGREVHIFDAASAPGGRIATRKVGGFCLDKGFQVLLTSYAGVWDLVSASALEPRFFDSGALMWDRGKLWTLRHPLWHPGSAAQAAWSDALPPRDKGNAMRWAAECVLLTSGEPKEREGEISALEELRRAEISPVAIERFFRPFFGGVLLDANLGSSAALLRFYTRRFALGRAFVPGGGMAEFARQLAAPLPESALHWNSPVDEIECDGERARAISVGGRRWEIEAVVLATNAQAACQLLRCPLPDSSPRVWTIFFAAKESLYDGRLIVLPAGRQRVVRHFVQITNVAPEYAPKGSHLVVATVLESRGHSPAGLARVAAGEIREVFPSAQLELLDIWGVPNPMVPQRPGFTRVRIAPPALTNLVLAGDYLSWASTEGAVLSGRRAAAALLKSPAP